MRVTQSVHFPVREVTSISRLPNPIETYFLVDLDQHVERCRQCQDWRRTRKLEDALCIRGLRMVAALLQHVVGSADGRIYSKDRACTQFERVEVPLQYHHVHGLFSPVKASMKRSSGQGCGLKGAMKQSRHQRVARGHGPEYTVVFRTSKKISRYTAH